MYIYGRNVAKEVTTAKKIFLLKNFKEIELVKHLNAPIVYLDKYKLDELVDGNHQGIVLEVEDFQYKNINELTGDKIVILDHLEDPHNLGAIIRTCEATGINNIILPKDRSVAVTGTVMKTSVGTLENMKIARVSNLVNTIKDLKNKGYWVIGTDMEGTNYKEIDYTGKIVIVIGNEGKGMSRLIKENCDFIASIPMKGDINSLNASVATALILFETIR